MVTYVAFFSCLPLRLPPSLALSLLLFAPLRLLHTRLSIFLRATVKKE